MKSFTALLPFVMAAVASVAADPIRQGHAASPIVSTSSKRDEVILDERRLGHAAASQVSTGQKRSDKAMKHRRSSSSAHSRRSGAKVSSIKAKRDLNSPVDPRAVSLTLHRPTQPLHERDIHPVMYFQQHVNHAQRRYAKFLGRTIDDEQLVHNLRRRAESLDLPFDVQNLRKRGAPLQLKGTKGGTGSTSTSSTTSTANSTAAAGAGFSQVALQDLEQNTVTAASNPTAANSLGLNIEANDVGYFATLQIGTPPTNFNILMDSGSADFWVPSVACQNSDTGAATCAHTTLGTNSSSSFAASQNAFAVTYGTGNVQGVLVQDNVNIAGLQLDAHTFGATTTESNDFAASTIPFDGLMGLAQSTLSQEGVLTPIESLAKAGTVASAQMGFSLASVLDNSNTGQVTFGGVDQTKFSGSLTLFSNVNTQGFWEGAMGDITVNGQSVNLAGRTAILDTGTTLIVAPPSDAAAVHAAIPGAASDGQGGFTLPCTSTAQVALSFGGQAFNINPADLAFQPTTNNLQGTCVSGISSGQVGAATEWLVGDVFLKNVYFATDVTNNQIGLAATSAA